VESAVTVFYRVAGRRLGLLFALAHLCVAVFAFAQKDRVKVNCDGDFGGLFNVENIAGASFVAGRLVHFYYESILLKALLLLDIPGMLLSVLIETPFWLMSFLLPKFCAHTESWIAAILLLAGTTVQWWLVGYATGQIVGRKRANQT
jgi:hypothetical protein